MNYNDKNEKFRELCYFGDVKLAREYFENQNPDLNSQNKVNGWTALHWAAKQNHLDLVKFLLEKGASKYVKNNEGKIAGNLSTDNVIRHILEADQLEVLHAPKQDDFVPSYKKYPEFHYATESRSLSKELSSSTSNNQISVDSPKTTLKTIKIKTNLDDDFVEIDLDLTNISFDEFKKICIREFDYVNIDFDLMKLDKIRKLPNILIRNTNDVRRLKDDQSVEFIFVNKNKTDLI